MTQMTPANLPQIVENLGILARIKDFFQPEEHLKIEWTSPDYRRLSLLYGLIEYERGERRTFSVQGKPGFCAAVVRDLSTDGIIHAVHGNVHSASLRKELPIPRL